MVETRHLIARPSSAFVALSVDQHRHRRLLSTFDVLKRSYGRLNQVLNAQPPPMGSWRRRCSSGWRTCTGSSLCNDECFQEEFCRPSRRAFVIGEAIAWPHALFFSPLRWSSSSLPLPERAGTTTMAVEVDDVVCWIPETVQDDHTGAFSVSQSPFSSWLAPATDVARSPVKLPTFQMPGNQTLIASKSIWFSRAGRHFIAPK